MLKVFILFYLARIWKLLGHCNFLSSLCSHCFHDHMHCAWQAYTNELENKVSRLEEENERLKKQQVPLPHVVKNS
jgi:hypothetical protein